MCVCVDDMGFVCVCARAFFVSVVICEVKPVNLFFSFSLDPGNIEDCLYTEGE